MTNHGLPDALAPYLAERDRLRQEAAAELWNSFTERQQGLIKDAAVMGYVQGMRHPHGEPILKDGAIVQLVVQHCQSFPDLYPAITNQKQPTPCSKPDGCDEDELCDAHETEQAHAEGEHEFCGITCETTFPSDQLRNTVLYRAIPGSSTMLDELLRRAQEGRA